MFVKMLKDDGCELYFKLDSINSIDDGTQFEFIHSDGTRSVFLIDAPEKITFVTRNEYAFAENFTHDYRTRTGHFSPFIHVI